MLKFILIERVQRNSSFGIKYFNTYDFISCRCMQNDTISKLHTTIRLVVGKLDICNIYFLIITYLHDSSLFFFSGYTVTIIISLSVRQFTAFSEYPEYCFQILWLQ